MFNFLFEGKIGEILAPVTGSNQLYLAIQHHKNSEVQSLIDSSSSYNLSQLSDGGVAAIHIACRYNNTFALDLILKQGVAVDLKDSVGNTPLHYASKYGHFEICKTLISQGCSPVTKNGSNQSPYDITDSHVIRQYLLPLQFQSEREQQQQQYPAPGQQLGISTGGSGGIYGYGNEVSGSNYDPYNNQGIMPLGVSGANSYSLPQQQQLPPPSPHGGQQQMPYNNFNNTSNLPQPPAFNSVPTAAANQQQSSTPQRNSFDNNQQPIQIQTQNQAPLVTIPSSAVSSSSSSSSAVSVVPPPPSVMTTAIGDTTIPLATVDSSFIPPSPKSNTFATATSSSSSITNNTNQQPGNRVFMPDGFHSSASDPALQLKYGHVKAAVSIAPPPTGMPTISGTGTSPYSMYSNSSGVGSGGIYNYSLVAAQQQPVTSALAPIASRYVGYDAHTNQAVNVNLYSSNNNNNFTNNNINSSPTHASNASNSFYPPTSLSAPVQPPSVMSMPSLFPMMSTPSTQTSHITISPPTQQSQPPPFFQPPSIQPVSVPPQASTTAAVQQQQQFQPLVKVFNPVTDSSAEVVSLSANSKSIL